MAGNKITGVVVSIILIFYVGAVAVGMASNTTYLTSVGVTGTNATIMGVIGILAAVAFLSQIAKKA